MMKQTIRDTYVPIVVFQSNQKFSKDKAKQYALERLYDGSYENCIIGSVFVDQQEVLRDYKI